MGHSLLIESVRPEVVPELLQLLACGTRHTNRRKDEHYGLFDISWKMVCAQDICLITFINELLDDSFTHGLLIECCAVNNTFCSICCSKWLTFWQSARELLSVNCMSGHVSCDVSVTLI